MFLRTSTYIILISDNAQHELQRRSFVTIPRNKEKQGNQNWQPTHEVHLPAVPISGLVSIYHT